MIKRRAKMMMIWLLIRESSKKQSKVAIWVSTVI
jgi:hypothetical protein